MMCADIGRIGETLDTFKKEGIELLHIDVMDGTFVQNYTLGTDFVRRVKKACSIPLDLHLMIREPERKLDWFHFGEGDLVSVHWEATNHPQAALSAIRARGAKAMLALNPGTPLCVLEELLPDLDGVLVMTVNPGFAGQKLIPQTLDKIRRLRTWLDEAGYGSVRVECDGNVSFENARKMKAAGADIFVAGTSSIYAEGHTLEENLKLLREAIL